MLLYLLRHADAESYATSDARRKLTPLGIAEAERVGRFCADHKIAPKRILASPYDRATQTATLVGRELGISPETGFFLESGMAPETALDELRDVTSDSMMLVGHEPDLSQLIALLTGASIHIMKASLTLVEASSFRPNAGILRFSVPVELMPL